MKKIYSIVLAGTLVLMGLSSCIEQIDPQANMMGSNKIVSGEQASNAPGSFDNFVTGLTNHLQVNLFILVMTMIPTTLDIPHYILHAM